ncbi:hypothetical protein JQ506_11885 [Shinella sp. PSBB067]|uniref:hypothetical protein n=1 Tax=unclassified Shinella TaxID=2643062 RepID=UPI00193BE72F|nr:MULTISPECIES: hypothetical protein [unclassified Shinella]MBN9054252.1 hypothetical protein [Hyphomicrobiales bacterium]QRI65620.1 hypothetical protein JQ506_11885 [Shinella sp. PSBB067]
MTTTVKKMFLAAALGLGALTASVPAASAAGLSITVEPVGYRNGFLQVQDYDGGWEREDFRGRRDRGDRWDDRRPDRRPGEWGRRGRCSPELAIAKARDFGLRRARIVDMSPRRVVVEGFRHGDYRRIVFANDRGCPAMWR